MTMRDEQARAWLFLGAAFGILLAVRGAIRLPYANAALPPHAVAMVGDIPITEQEYSRAVAAVESDRSERADTPLRHHVMDRLIEEELLVQSALLLGLPTRDPRLRGEIASAMLDSVIGEPAPTPSEDELRAFYAARAASFAHRGRLQVEALFFRGDDRTSRASRAREMLLAGEPFDQVAKGADQGPTPPPREALPTAKLAEYVGREVADALANVAEGGVAGPLPTEGGAWVLRVVARTPSEALPYESARNDVVAEFRREQDDRRLRSWFTDRRNATHVVVREELP